MNKKIIIIAVLAVLAIIVLSKSIFVVNEHQQAVIVVFGKVEGTLSEPGLNFKLPWADARMFEKRWLEWDGDPSEITTADKRYIAIDVFARWRIDNLSIFIEKLRDEVSAQGRLDDIIDSATRTVIANHALIEAIRTTNRKFVESDEELQASGGSKVPQPKPVEAIAEIPVEDNAEADAGVEKETEADSDGGVPEEEAVAVTEPEEKEIHIPTLVRMSQKGGATDNLYTITTGRQKLTRLILEKASVEAAKLGIELKDVQIKRIDYISTVQAKVFDRMISERRRVAEAFRSQGHGLSAEILGQKDRELKNIRSEAYKKAEEIKGRAEAEAASIYAKAYNKDPEFYQFLKTMESYKQTVDEDTWMLLTTNADYARHFSEIK